MFWACKKSGTLCIQRLLVTKWVSVNFPREAWILLFHLGTWNATLHAEVWRSGLFIFEWELNKNDKSPCRPCLDRAQRVEEMAVENKIRITPTRLLMITLMLKMITLKCRGYNFRLKLTCWQSWFFTHLWGFYFTQLTQRLNLISFLGNLMWSLYFLIYCFCNSLLAISHCCIFIDVQVV